MNIATTSRTTETATCPPTSTARPQRRRRPGATLSLAFITAVRSVRVAWIAGTRPKITALATATTRLKSSARRSIWNDERDRQVGRQSQSAGRASCRHSRRRDPARRRRSAISRLSVTSWRTSRPRPAPIARRSAISRARTGARLVNSPATLAHATNSTASASVDSIAISIASGGSCAILACSSVRTTRPRFLFVSGYARSRSAAIAVSSVCACRLRDARP